MSSSYSFSSSLPSLPSGPGPRSSFGTTTVPGSLPSTSYNTASSLSDLRHRQRYQELNERLASLVADRTPVDTTTSPPAPMPVVPLVPGADLDQQIEQLISERERELVLDLDLDLENANDNNDNDGNIDLPPVVMSKPVSPPPGTDVGYTFPASGYHRSSFLPLDYPLLPVDTNSVQFLEEPAAAMDNHYYYNRQQRYGRPPPPYRHRQFQQQQVLPPPFPAGQREVLATFSPREQGWRPSQRRTFTASRFGAVGERLAPVYESAS
ncbi:hypothetical protein HRR83_002835 [Exophiala dermatitidis]|uniref:Uncharacterized protein n=2 Tax=Exophiala dermatitidis TaxID=5970 RepID=H6C110_EXODN|nr:uncharacterized protein HMPREF1120_05389 [Exophiala dermatitidis NIH/UT8656]KAJ4520732.1 hypothetical protein HRR74_003733 [Exophiala dermatitidis]EHY57348.1 hypothetical protein HMPREF1120_05389 [Exophiala dermatitidis NIH/UT8656]KAJ4521874.1 hypothetical protein HRR73_003073 [Exophiala dermatitidis]KAJ4535875.1 hypothetical protein HRR78_008739 [Exophiala dermatitidis]KAJ4537621.1 hypothetical protein HRR76_005612 [Exophiala dermatitidis]